MSIQGKLQKGRDRLNKASNDADLLGLALASIHGALEDACRSWLAAPHIRQQHGVDVQNKAEVNWQNLLELMPRYCGWSERDVRYVRRINSLRNKAAHGDGFEGTRQDVAKYLRYVENAIAKNGSFSNSTSETSSSFTKEYFPNNISQGGAVKPFRFRIERSDRGVRIYNCKRAKVIQTKTNFVKTFQRLGLFVGSIVVSFIFVVIVYFALKDILPLIPNSDKFAGLAMVTIFLISICCLLTLINKVLPRSVPGIFITGDCIYIGRKSYPTPGGTFFRFIHQNIPGLFKLHVVQPDGVVYLAHNLTWHEADELLRIVVKANQMTKDSRSQFCLELKDGLIFIKSLKTKMSFVIEHNEKLWQSLRCRMLTNSLVELTKSELEELYSKKLQAFRV